MTPDDLVKAALDVAEDGLARGELPIGAVVEMGAAMALKVDDVYYALESPADGGAAVAAGWPVSPELPWYRPPTIIAGIRRSEARDQFRRYSATAPDSGLRRWAGTMAG
ncbi:hypothetical protein ACFY36_30490 [Actinoplanes sp. NPDC000266]